jgi:hypothetical protein
MMADAAHAASERVHHLQNVTTFEISHDRVAIFDRGEIVERTVEERG